MRAARVACRGFPSGLRWRMVLCGVVGLQTFACARSDGTDQTTGPTEVVRLDSAGVGMIELSRTALESLPAWSIGAEPLLSVGEAEGDPDRLFGRILAALRLESGNIVVVDGPSLMFRRFSSEGEFLGQFGGLGDGPGEFRGVGKVRRLDGGQVGVLDTQLRRVSVFDSAGSLLRTAPFPCSPGGTAPRGEPAPCYAVDLLGDGTLLTSGTRRAGPTPSPVLDEFQSGPPGTTLLALATEAVMHVVDSVPAAGRARIIVERGGSRALWDTKELFDPDGRWTATPSGIVVGAGDRYELRYLTATGRLERVVRLTGEPERSTRGHIETISEWAETIESHLASEFTQRYLESVEVDRPMPPFGELRSDGAGRIWAADYFPPSPLGPPEPVMWTVFSEEGLPIGRIETRSARDLLDVGSDYVLLREADALGVERIVLHSIVGDEARLGS